MTLSKSEDSIMLNVWESIKFYIKYMCGNSQSSSLNESVPVKN